MISNDQVKVSHEDDAAGGRHLVELAKFKKERAPYTLEFWYYVRPVGVQARAIRSFLWVSGPTQMPDRKGRIQKTLDEMIRECPSCDYLFMPPVRSFVKILGVPEGKRPVQYVTCAACLHQYPKEQLADNRTFVGTVDRVGTHLALRYEQLRRVLMQRVVGGGIVADQVSAPEAADVLMRVMKKPTEIAGLEARDGVKGSLDRLITAKTMNNEQAVYIFADDLVRMLGTGRSLPSIFSSMLVA